MDFLLKFVGLNKKISILFGIVKLTPESSTKYT